jgi:hypothetical protein
MLLYEVTLQVVPAVAQRVEEHMRKIHIPAILATGCFQRIRFARASPARFRTSYQAETQADLDRYLHDHAPAFRAELLAEFPDGFTATREVWTEVEGWG